MTNSGALVGVNLRNVLTIGRPNYLPTCTNNPRHCWNAGLLKFSSSVQRIWLNESFESLNIYVLTWVPNHTTNPMHNKVTMHWFSIWVKLPWTYIFPKFCHFFCNFDSCFRALFALVRLFQLFLRVNHMCHSRENQVFDPSPQVRYLKKTSKHGRFWGF